MSMGSTEKKAGDAEVAANERVNSSKPGKAAEKGKTAGSAGKSAAKASGKAGKTAKPAQKTTSKALAATGLGRTGNTILLACMMLLFVSMCGIVFKFTKAFFPF